MSEPLPGTHLCRVDCIDCGAYTLAVPDYPEPRCNGCGRRHHGADNPVAPPPYPRVKLDRR